MIRDRAAGPVREVAFGQTGVVPVRLRPKPAGDAPPTDPSPRPSPEVLAALRDARAVIVGPSNPVVSIWPILHTLGDALDGLAAPVVCVSPVVGGEIVKGPTAAFLAAYGQSVSAAGVAAFYDQVARGLLEGIAADEPVTSLPAIQLDTAMPDATARARVADRTLAFAESLGR
jgi:LPPG:FO 2-phospho-L-lactate transferase